MVHNGNCMEHSLVWLSGLGEQHGNAKHEHISSHDGTLECNAPMCSHASALVEMANLYYF